ncbi:MAG: EthD family reductase [Methylovulum sp.]|nr:EthD family reductase [Methylovulum sp.]
MIKISILYPNKPDARFDIPYYLETHIPMVLEVFNSHPGYKGVSIDRGLAGAIPGTAAAYAVMCHFLFDSVDDFMAAFTPHAEKLQGDIANYTDIEPVIQVNEVLLSN